MERSDPARQNADDRERDGKIGKTAHPPREFLVVAKFAQELLVFMKMWVHVRDDNGSRSLKEERKGLCSSFTPSPPPTTPQKLQRSDFTARAGLLKVLATFNCNTNACTRFDRRPDA